MNSKPDYQDTGGYLVTKDNPRIASLFQSIDRVLKRMELVLKNARPVLNGECYLTDKEAAQRLMVSRRTLQDYRNRGVIPYCQLGGKILYRESDIEKMVDDGYREAYR